VLIADDYSDDIEHIINYLPGNFQARTAESVEEARALLESEHIVVAILDLYLDRNNRVPHGLQLMRDFKHVPAILMSGRDGAMIDHALSGFDQRALKFVSKDSDLNTGEQVRHVIDTLMQRHYDMNLALKFRQASDWRNIALLLSGATSGTSSTDLDARAYELEMLVRQAFHEWDRSTSDYVRATQLWIEEQIHAGDNSIVLRLSLLSKFDAPQAEVVLKITRQSEEHSKFDAFKNVLGGYGLRERRYARTCNYHAQVYSVPYYRYEQTSTYRDFFMRSGSEPDSLRRIEAITRHLFHDALGHFADRPPTGRNTLDMRDYYLKRINARKRVTAITGDLTPDKAPASIALSADSRSLMVGTGSGRITLVNPVEAVLVTGQYRSAKMMVDTALRHGDMHGSNVLIDAQRLSTWYIDYEHFGVDHYALADHVEMEAHLLFNAMRISSHLSFWAQFSRMLIASEDLELSDVSVPATDEARDTAEAEKALAAIKVIRSEAAHSSTGGSTTSYYHALLFEALRTAGARSKEPRRRWHALVTAALLFERIERVQS
jgi:DNA-binding response OmpR family regulator